MSWPLHLRLAAAMAAVMAALALALLAVVHGLNGRAVQEAAQRMNLGLADYIAAHLPAPLLDAQGRVQHRAVADLAQHVMAIHPAVEVYLLGADGRVLAHALGTPPADDPVGRRVDLAAVAPLLAAGPSAVALPVLGDDPRRPGQRVPVSLARLHAANAAAGGFLYVVLQGQAQRSVAAQVAPSLVARELAVGFALVGLGAALVAGMLVHGLTRPLRRLAGLVQGICTDGTAAAPPVRNEVALLEAAVAALRRRVDEQLRQLQDADQLRRDLVSGISHDLRTPLAILRGNLETLLIKGEVFDAERRRHCTRTALRQSERLRQHIAALFELSRLDSGHMAPRLEPFCLAELLQDVVQGYQTLARARGVQVALAANSHHHAPVLADIALIERVLQNLVDNALRATPTGGSVTLSVLADGAHYRVSVSDTGRGIAAEHLPHIFERYWRAGDDDELPQGSSSGLGLAIVKRILDIHGSVVAVRSERAAGTRIEFQLPGLAAA